MFILSRLPLRDFHNIALICHLLSTVSESYLNLNICFFPNIRDLLPMWLFSSPLIHLRCPMFISITVLLKLVSSSSVFFETLSQKHSPPPRVLLFHPSSTLYQDHYVHDSALLLSSQECHFIYLWISFSMLN